MYLPPYSPDFNPIEEPFSYLKSYILQHVQQFHANVSSGEDHRVFMFIHEALLTMTKQHIKGWFHDCGYI